jgi:hypothetical protein
MLQRNIRMLFNDWWLGHSQNFCIRLAVAVIRG